MLDGDRDAHPHRACALLGIGKARVLDHARRAWLLGQGALVHVEQDPNGAVTDGVRGDLPAVGDRAGRSVPWRRGPVDVPGVAWVVRDGSSIAAPATPPSITNFKPQIRSQSSPNPLRAPSPSTNVLPSSAVPDENRTRCEWLGPLLMNLISR